nr:testis-expressed protein 10 homolog [Onthophagus taurus]
MGKNHRHSKNLKSERSKIKLKTQKTKFLPKGLNVTNTNFKIKPIVVPHQLVQHKSQVTSQNLDFKDIMNRIKHHNVTVNLNSLQQLKEFIYIVQNNVLDKYVLQICELLCPLYVHIDQKLRREAITLTHHLIKLIKSVGIEPHINRIVSYLCCMMTHLNENVQEDSLRLFDVLIQSIPGLLATRCDKIIQNFVLLISKIKINANDKSMLQTTIKNKRTSVEWRLMVLTRFNEFLGVILTRKKQENVIDIVPINIIKVERQRISAPIYYKKEEIDIYRDDINVDVWLDDCVKDVLVLLKGIWLEVQPSNKHSIQSAQLFCTVINNEVLNILHCILSIISSFYELMVIKTQENQEIKIVG